jgi:hypothetical protein
MPRIVAFHCPHCGAALSVDADDRDVTCKFCQVKSVIHRTVERPMPQPPWPGPPPAPMPAQTSSGGGAAIVVVAAVGMLVLAGAGAAFWLLSSAPGPGPRSSPPSVAVADPLPTKPEAPSYEFASTQDGGLPLFVDANRDGTLDVLVQSGYPKRLLAFDGASGRPLWTTSLEGAGFSTHVAVAESRVVVASDVSVELLDASTGKRSARATLNDKARRLCAPSAGKLRVHLFDNSVDTIDPSTGAVSSEAKGARCDDLYTARGLVEETERRHYPVVHLDPALGGLRCGGIQVRGTWNYLRPDPCGPALRMSEAKLGELEPSAIVPMRGGHLLLGRKARGKRTPMIGFAKGGALVWSETLSKAEPADLPEGDANRVALYESLLGAVYPGPKGDRLALFDTGTGKRTHDLELPAPIHAIRSRGDGKLVLVGKHQILLVDGSGKLTTLLGP